MVRKRQENNKKNNDKMIKTVKHYVQPDVRNLMGLESGSPLCTSIPTYNDGGSLGDDFNESGYFEESDF